MNIQLLFVPSFGQKAVEGGTVDAQQFGRLELVAARLTQSSSYGVLIQLAAPFAPAGDFGHG